MLVSLTARGLISFHLRRIIRTIYLSAKWHLVNSRLAENAIRTGLIWRCIHFALLKGNGLYGVFIVNKAHPLSSFTKPEE